MAQTVLRIHEGLSHKGAALNDPPLFSTTEGCRFVIYFCTLETSKRRGEIPNEPNSHRQLHRAQARGTESHAGAAGAAARRVQQDHL